MKVYHTQKQQRKRNTIFMSIFIIILSIIIFISIVYITHVIESKLNLEPIVLFSLSEVANGIYNFTFLTFNGQIDLSWLI